MEASHGLNKPKIVQYGIYWKKMIFQGDMGQSFNFKGIPVKDILGQSFPVSFQLGIVAMIFGCGIGLPLGIIAALYKNKWPDYLSMVIAMAGICLPAFVVETIFQIPGMGQHFIDAVLAKDIYLILGLVFFYGVLMGLANLAVDLLLLFINPRLRS